MESKSRLLFNLSSRSSSLLYFKRESFLSTVLLWALALLEMCFKLSSTYWKILSVFLYYYYLISNSDWYNCFRSWSNIFLRKLNCFDCLGVVNTILIEGPIISLLRFTKIVRLSKKDKLNYLLKVTNDLDTGHQFHFDIIEIQREFLYDNLHICLLKLTLLFS